MRTTQSAVEADWLTACRRAASELERMLAEAPTTAERALETGTRGSGGDRTLIIDRSAEDLVLAELEAMREQGHSFVALSEERGEIDYGDRETRGVIDPIDGPLKPKRGLPPHRPPIRVAARC